MFVLAKNGRIMRDMADLKTPDLCAQLDRMKGLCDQLEAAQSDSARAREIVERIRIEADALANTVETLHHDSGSQRAPA
jgi:hypothetical protein